MDSHADYFNRSLIILRVPAHTMSRARSRVPRGRAHRGNYVHEAFLEMILRITRASGAPSTYMSVRPSVCADRN